MKTMATVKSYENKCATNYSITSKIGTTRTTTSSSPSTTPTTTLTQCTCTSTDAWRTCTESARTAHSSTVDDTAHLMAQVLSAFIVIHGHIHGRTSLTRFSALYFFLFLLSVTVFLFHLELFLELHYTKDMANCAVPLQKREREDTLNVFIPPAESLASPDEGAAHELPEKIDEAGMRAENLNWHNHQRSG